MRKSLADSRDFNAGRRQSFAWRKIAYKIGSPMKGCLNCGEWEMEQYGKRQRRKYTSGHDVWRSYCPKQTGWTYYCYTCSAMDHKAWENADDVGEDAIGGARDVVAAIRSDRRKDKTRSTSRSKTKPLSREELDSLAESVQYIFKKGE